MKQPVLAMRIIAARPEGYGFNVAFTDTVMQNIRKPEILSATVRNMSVTKKETFMKKFKRLPALAIVAIAIGVAALLSGSAYAAYQLLWPKPTVQISAPTTSQTGRKQVDALFTDCGANSHTLGYELKKNATITEDQIPAVVQAHCELDAIGTWANETFPNDYFKYDPSKMTEPTDRTMLSTSMATHILSSSDDSITFVGLTKYGQKDASYDLSTSTRYVVDGHEAKASDIKKDAPVVYITSQTIKMTRSGDCSTSCSTSGMPVGTTLLAVVQLSLPFENYDQFAWQSLAERTSCLNNDQDVCLTGFAASIDVYSGTSSPVANAQAKIIEGVITSIDGTTLEMRSSSGRIFKISTPTDFVTSFNANRASEYNNQTIKVGSTLSMTYYEPLGSHSLSVNGAMLSTIQLRIEIVGKSDAPGTY